MGLSDPSTYHLKFLLIRIVCRYRMHRKRRGHPSVITVFSAPNFLDGHLNRAAVLKCDGKSHTVQQFHRRPHPFRLPDFMDASSADQAENAYKYKQENIDGQLEDLRRPRSPKEKGFGFGFRRVNAFLFSFLFRFTRPRSASVAAMSSSTAPPFDQCLHSTTSESESSDCPGIP